MATGADKLAIVDVRKFLACFAALDALEVYFKFKVIYTSILIHLLKGIITKSYCHGQLTPHCFFDKRVTPLPYGSLFTLLKREYKVAIVYLTSPEPSKNCYNLFTLHPI